MQAIGSLAIPELRYSFVALELLTGIRRNKKVGLKNE
jgi:hypothetical protein